MIGKLRSYYEKQGLSNQVMLQRKLRQMTYTDSEDIKVFIAEFEKTVNALKNCGGTMSNEEVTMQLLFAMPDSYQHVTTAIDIVNSQLSEKVTLDFVKNKLLSEAERRCKAEPNSGNAFFTQKNVTKKKFPFRCYNCGKRGHMKAACRLPRKVYEQRCNMAEFTEVEEAFITTTATEGDRLNNSFVLDSGCTSHMIDKETGKFLVNVQRVEVSIGIAMQGTHLIARRKGTLLVKFDEKEV